MIWEDFRFQDLYNSRAFPKDEEIRAGEKIPDFKMSRILQGASQRVERSGDRDQGRGKISDFKISIILGPSQGMECSGERGRFPD